MVNNTLVNAQLGGLLTGATKKITNLTTNVDRHVTLRISSSTRTLTRGQVKSDNLINYGDKHGAIQW